MSAETLRRAAALMRERAVAAKAWDGNWQVHDSKPGRVIEVKGDGWDDAIIASCVDYGGTENGTEYAAHIASWHPAVALAVADWLWETANLIEVHAGTECAEPCLHPTCRVIDRALAVARAYLEEAS